MASIYEIDRAILSCIDAETGEIINIEQLEQLQLERSAKIENVAKWIINLEADAKAFKERREYFEKRERATKNKIERLKNYLESALQGEEYSSADKEISISYITRKVVDIEDLDGFIKWAEENADALLRYSDPTVNKTAIKEAIALGEEVKGAKVIERRTIQVK